jgi:hypothetical protein
MQSISKLVTVNLRYACVTEFCVLYNCMGLNSVLECLRLFFFLVILLENVVVTL